MPILESAIERRVVGWAEAHGIDVVKLNIKGRRGWPDRLFLIWGGRPLFIEFKRPNGKARPLQLHIHQRLRARGYQVEVHDDTEQAIQAIKRAQLAAPSVSTSGRQVPA